MSGDTLRTADRQITDSDGSRENRSVRCRLANVPNRSAMFGRIGGYAHRPMVGIRFATAVDINLEIITRVSKRAFSLAGLGMEAVRS